MPGRPSNNPKIARIMKGQFNRTVYAGIIIPR
jgi:hypothetical protein